MASISTKPDESALEKFSRQERRRNTALHPSMPLHEARSPRIINLDQIDKCESLGELIQPLSPTFNITNKPTPHSRTLNKLLKARSPKGKKSPHKPEFVSFGRKNDYFRTEAVVMNHPLVTKEMLNHDIDIDHEEDHDLLVSILKKRPPLRVKEEVLFTQAALKPIKFFSDIESQLDSTSYSNLFKNLGLEKFTAGQKIFNHGDFAKKFYIILQGSVYILLKNEGLIIKEENHCDSNQADPDREEKLQKILNSDVPEDEKKKKVEELYPGFWIVRSTHKGELFGELGLQKSGNRLRSATVVCREDTIVGVWNQEDYGLIFAKIYEAKYNEKINFLKKIDAFSHWTTNQISSLVMHVEEYKYARNKIILKEGETPHLFYFIKSGEIELRKNVNLPEDERSEILQTLEEKDKFGRNQTHKQKKQDSIRVGKIVQGDYFGISSSLEKKPSDFTATVTSSEVTLITISTYKFLRFVRDQITLEKLTEHFTCRDSWHEKMISNFLQINTHFSTKLSGQQPKQAESPLILSRKIKSVYKEPLSESDHIPKIHIKNSYIQSSETSSESSRRSSLRTAKPHKFSMEDNMGSASASLTLDSHRLFKNNSKTSKFGLAYEKHQTKLKRYFSDKDKAEALDTSAKQSKTKLNLKQLTCPDSAVQPNSRDPFSDYGQNSNYLVPKFESSACSSGSAEGLGLFRCHTEEGAPSVLPHMNLAKPHNMPISIKSINSPQFIHVRTKSGPFYSVDNQKFKLKRKVNTSTTENERSKTEDSSEIDKLCSFTGKNPMKRTSSFAMRKEARIIITPNTINTFRKKS